jgi:hypothetical protein
VHPIDLLTVAVLAFFGSRLFVSFRRSLSPESRARSVELFKGLRLRHFVPVPVVLALVIGTALLLLQIPPLQFGWWSAIGGQGNPVFGSTERTAGTPLEWIVPIVFIVLLTPALPLLVEREEVMFRLGAESWPMPQRIWKAVSFGLVHAVVGIPIGVAIALSIGGGYFTLVYLRAWRQTGSRRAALDESTRAHLGYDLTVVGVVFVGLALSALVTLLQ